MTHCLVTAERPGTFPCSSATVSLELLRSLVLIAVIILLVSFLPWAASDLLFLGAGLRDIRFQ